MKSTALDELCINTIRTLSIDAVQQADSGHPGTPMALAPVVYTLWQRHLRFDPQDPLWPDRDRFVLSVGHASMLLYSLLFLTGVKDRARDRPSITLDDIKRFRQLGSPCAGHPEYHLAAGIETTTGPLGQGVATSVGMAIGERWLAQQLNRPDHTLIDHRTYALCGDGDMMEGISSEAASLAGHLKLARLCWIYDSNHITIDGPTAISFTEDTAKRFAAYGWHVETIEDANDVAALDRALDDFKARDDKPTFIIIHSHIGYGAPHKQGTNKAHGEALGRDEVRLTKAFYGWPEDALFLVPDGVEAQFDAGIGTRGARLSADWRERLSAYRREHPAAAAEFDRIEARALPPGWDQDLPSFPADAKGLASREASAKVINILAAHYPWLLGGAADLAASTKTTLKDFADFQDSGHVGRNFHFGIREHAMAAVVNGLALHKLRAFGSSFLIFSDYLKPALRLSALMRLPTIFIFTHDSIGVGEDGPTHQPIEQLAMLRAMPGLITLRPADANEVVECWRVIAQAQDQPICLILSRQSLPTFDRHRYASAAGVAQGGYILGDDAEGRLPEVILIATGSEVGLCVTAFERLQAEKIAVRIVSLPSWELFERQPILYRETLLPPAITARVAVEQAATLGWERYAGLRGKIIGMTSFGASAPYADLQRKFGFTADHVYEAAKAEIARVKEKRA